MAPIITVAVLGVHTNTSVLLWSVDIGKESIVLSFTALSILTSTSLATTLVIIC